MVIKGLLAIGASIRLRELEEYLKTTEKYLQIAKTDFETRFDEQSKTLSPEERYEFNEFYSDAYWDYAETYPRILRSSFLVSALSLLEHEMWRICGWLNSKKLIQSSWNDIKGNFFERFKKCCKEARLPLSFNDQAWEKIQEYYLVRNCIVHNMGFIKGSKGEKELLPYAIKRNITEESIIFPAVRPQDKIALTEQFNKDVLKTVWAFLSKVLEACEVQRQEQEKGD